MNKNLTLQFNSSVSDVVDINDSFSSCILTICYAGKNRNKVYLDKQVIEDAIPTMFNCPIVCNYDVEDDSIGGHDVKLIRTDDGDLRMINLTSAIGVIPANAKYWWETINENGEDHEYLKSEAILWKRSPAYEKIAADGIESQSMEISIGNKDMDDGILRVYDFQFTAFCLLGEGVEPCFESASIQMFSKSTMDNMREEFSRMKDDFKNTFSQTQPVNGFVSYSNKLEGGNEAMEEKLSLIKDYGLEAEALEFSIDEMSIEDLKAKLDEIKTETQQKEFALMEAVRESIFNALYSVKINTEYGEYCLWGYVDMDVSKKEVYAINWEDGYIYAIPYAENGDNIELSFDTKRKQKIAYEDFDEGVQEATFANTLTDVLKNSKANTELESQFQALKEESERDKEELDSLRQFKLETEANEKESKCNEIFAKFEVLKGVEEFDAIVADHSEYELSQLEEKCFAILGRNKVEKHFSLEPKKNPAGAPKLKIENDFKNKADEPYAGVFIDYGVAK